MNGKYKCGILMASLFVLQSQMLNINGKQLIKTFESNNFESKNILEKLQNQEQKQNDNISISNQETVKGLQLNFEIDQRFLIDETTYSSSSQLRQSLYDLIDMKNKIPRYDLDLDSVPNKYRPEDSGYIQGLIYMTFVILFAAAIFILAFILFTGCRLVFKKCGGQIKQEDVENFNPDTKRSFVCGFILLSGFFMATSTILIIGNVGYFKSAMQSTDQIDSQANQLANNLQTLRQNLQTLNDASLQDYIQKYKVKMNFDVNLIDSQVTPDVNIIQSNSQGNQKKMNALEIGVFVWVFLSFAIGLLFLILNCVSMSKNWAGVSLANGLISFFMIGVTIALVAMKHGQLIYLVDFCEQMISIDTQSQIPTIGSGISRYLSCIPYNSTSILTTIGYQGSIEYQKGIILCNERLQTFGNDNAITTLEELNFQIQNSSPGYYYQWYLYSGVIALALYFMLLTYQSLRLSIYISIHIQYESLNYAKQQNSFDIDKMHQNMESYHYNQTKPSMGGQRSMYKLNQTTDDYPSDNESLMKKGRKSNMNGLTSNSGAANIDMSFNTYNNISNNQTKKTRISDNTGGKKQDYSNLNNLDLTKEFSSHSKNDKKKQGFKNSKLNSKGASYDNEDLDLLKSSDSVLDYTHGGGDRSNIFEAKDISSIKKKEKGNKRQQRREVSDFT
eukprot:403375994